MTRYILPHTCLLQCHHGPLPLTLPLEPTHRPPLLTRGGALPLGLVWGDFALCAQVAERQLQACEADQQEEEEEEEARQAEQLSSALLQQEAKLMAEQGYWPKVGSLQMADQHGRTAQRGPCPLRLFIAQDPALLPSQLGSSLLCSCVSPFPD